MDKIVGLKEFRQDVDKYVKYAQKGDTVLVVKKSKPFFRIGSPEDERWETLIDFTKIKKGGVDIDEILSRLGEREWIKS